MDEILAILKKLFPILLMVVLMAPSALFSKKRKEAREKARKNVGSPPPVGDSELARRVQKNFEDLMKKRTGQALDSGPEPEAWKPIATIPAPARPAPTSPAPRNTGQGRKAPPQRTTGSARTSSTPPRQKPPRTAPTHSVSLPQDPRHSEAYDISSDAYRVTGQVEQEARNAYRVDAASTSQPIGANRARQILLGGGKMGRHQLRRAILLKEILDRPVCEQRPRDPTQAS